MKRIMLLAAICSGALVACTTPPAATDASAPAAVAVKADAGLAAAIANPARAQANSVRDIHRHPAETLAFFGVKPNMTVIEIVPGAGYYTEILAPYLTAVGGKYIGTGNAIASLWRDEACDHLPTRGLRRRTGGSLQ